MKGTIVLMVGMALGAALCSCKCKNPMIKQFLKKINIE